MRVKWGDMLTDVVLHAENDVEGLIVVLGGVDTLGVNVYTEVGVKGGL